jgi:hypothetical protein
MQELWQLTKLIRSKNAGPFELTFDVMFKDLNSFEQALESHVLCPAAIAQLYRIDVSQVRFFRIDNLLAIKITIPRQIFSGDVRDTDIYGGQFHGPLVRLQIGVPAMAI